MTVKTVIRIFLFSAILFQISCARNEFVPIRETIDLSGTWQFALDSAGTGITGKWFGAELDETVELPGTLDENNKGFINTNHNETMRLSRERMYEGMAWYQKRITIGKSWGDKEIFLILERTKPSKVWIDDQYIGENQTILTQQKYNLTNKLIPGDHTLTIMVNNGQGSVPDGIKGSHAWTEHTQTNWNGIIGEILLEAVPKNYIQSVHVIPDIQNHQAKVTLKLNNSGNAAVETKVKLSAASWNAATTHTVTAKTYKVTLGPGENQVELIYPIGKKMQYWSEFSPALYRLTVTMKTPE
ncbi:MAG: hypothetical protein EOM73_03630, partial [Bacteroidia bacterium]|nr:hypothetical protein [Bacteroidia bacterium]